MRVVNNWCKTRGIYYRNIKVPTNFFTLYGVREIQIMATDLLLELSPKCHRMHHLGVNRLYCSETDRPVPTSSNCIYIINETTAVLLMVLYARNSRIVFDFRGESQNISMEYHCGKRVPIEKNSNRRSSLKMKSRQFSQTFLFAFSAFYCEFAKIRIVFPHVYVQ